MFLSWFSKQWCVLGLSCLPHKEVGRGQSRRACVAGACCCFSHPCGATVCAHCGAVVFRPVLALCRSQASAWGTWGARAPRAAPLRRQTPSRCTAELEVCPSVFPQEDIGRPLACVRLVQSPGRTRRERLVVGLLCTVCGLCGRATNGQPLSSSPALFLLGAALGRLWLLWLCPVVRDLAARLRQPMCTFVSVCGVAARRPCLAQSSGGL